MRTVSVALEGDVRLHVVSVRCEYHNSVHCGSELQCALLTREQWLVWVRWGVCEVILCTVLQGKENCYYQGRVEEHPDWSVVISTCYGIRYTVCSVSPCGPRVHVYMYKMQFVQHTCMHTRARVLVYGCHLPCLQRTSSLTGLWHSYGVSSVGYSGKTCHGRCGGKSTHNLPMPTFLPETVRG